MSDTSKEKFVEFDKYCLTCEHSEIPNGEEPCEECLCTPTNIDSHKPINYKDKNA